MVARLNIEKKKKNINFMVAMVNIEKLQKDI